MIGNKEKWWKRQGLSVMKQCEDSPSQAKTLQDGGHSKIWEVKEEWNLIHGKYNMLVEEMHGHQKSTNKEECVSALSTTWKSYPRMELLGKKAYMNSLGQGIRHTLADCNQNLCQDRGHLPHNLGRSCQQAHSPGCWWNFSFCECRTEDQVFTGFSYGIAISSFLILNASVAEIITRWLVFLWGSQKESKRVWGRWHS